MTRHECGCPDWQWGFDPSAFRRALLAAYDALHDPQAPQSPVSLRDVHRFLADRARCRYTLQQFATDLCRVRSMGLVERGRRIQFIHGRRRPVVVPVPGGETETLVGLQVL